MAGISLALLKSTSFTWCWAYLKARLDAVQNTVTISKASSDAVKALSNVKELKIADTTHVVTLCGLAPDGSFTRFIWRVPLRSSEAEILANFEKKSQWYLPLLDSRCCT